MSIENYPKFAATMSDQEKPLLPHEHRELLREPPSNTPQPFRFAGLHRLQLSKAAHTASWMICFCAIYWIFSCFIPEYKLAWQVAPSHRETAVCGQQEPLRPITNPDVVTRLGYVYGDRNFSAKAAAWLGGAVRIP